MFSYFLDVLEVVTAVLVRRAIGPLTGAMPAARRREILDQFTARPDPCLLVSQIEAGGVGPNIQPAPVVIITEPQWKPSTESQAIARAHRKRQEDTVLVHRMLARSTVDERIQELLEHKTALFDACARPSDAKEADAPGCRRVHDLGGRFDTPAGEHGQADRALDIRGSGGRLRCAERFGSRRH